MEESKKEAVKILLNLYRLDRITMNEATLLLEEIFDKTKIPYWITTYPPTYWDTKIYSPYTATCKDVPYTYTDDTINGTDCINTSASTTVDEGTKIHFYD